MNSEIEISQLKEVKSNVKSREWLKKLELIVTFKQVVDGTMLSSNKYSELLKQIIIVLIPKHEREWMKTTFQWHIFKKSGVRQIQEVLKENNIKFIMISSE